MIELLDGVTNTDAIRATLGVAEAAKELPDEYFTARKIEGALRLELSSWLPDTLENLQDAADAADDGDAAILVWDAVQQAASHWCAWEVCKTAPIALFQSLEDGQNKVTRPTINQKELLEHLSGNYMAYRDKALSLSTPDTPVVASVSWALGRSTPASDPVTNT